MHPARVYEYERLGEDPNESWRSKDFRHTQQNIVFILGWVDTVFLFYLKPAKMEKRNWFIFYHSFWEAISELPNENQLALYQAIANFSFNLKEPKLSGINKTVWILIKPQLEANNRRYQNSKKWWAPKGNKNASKDWDIVSKQPNYNLKTTKLQPKEKEKDKVKVKEKVKEKVNKNKDKYLEFVFLSKKEYDTLLDIFWERGLNNAVETLNNYIWSQGKDKYKSHYHTIRTWNKEIVEKWKLKQEAKEKSKSWMDESII